MKAIKGFHKFID